MSKCDLAAAADIKCSATNGFLCDTAVRVKGHGGRKQVSHRNEIHPLVPCDTQIGASQPSACQTDLNQEAGDLMRLLKRRRKVTKSVKQQVFLEAGKKRNLREALYQRE